MFLVLFGAANRCCTWPSNGSRLRSWRASTRLAGASRVDARTSTQNSSVNQFVAADLPLQFAFLQRNGQSGEKLYVSMISGLMAIGKSPHPNRVRTSA